MPIMAHTSVMTSSWRFFPEFARLVCLQANGFSHQCELIRVKGAMFVPAAPRSRLERSMLFVENQEEGQCLHRR
jgi:hypothetical protein